MAEAIQRIVTSHRYCWWAEGEVALDPSIDYLVSRSQSGPDASVHKPRDADEEDSFNECHVQPFAVSGHHRAPSSAPSDSVILHTPVW